MVTHQHRDHNRIELCAQKLDCRIITSEEVFDGGRHNYFNVNGGVSHTAEACNEKHDPKKYVGYIITFDSVKIYASGDTPRTRQMERFAELEIDYAILAATANTTWGRRRRPIAPG